MSLSVKPRTDTRVHTAPPPPAPKAASDTALNKMPPDALVKSWLWMAYMCRDEAIKVQGKRNLKRAFGSCQNAIAYMEARQGK